MAGTFHGQGEATSLPSFAFHSRSEGMVVTLGLLCNSF